MAYLMRNQSAYEDMLCHQPILANGQATIDTYFALWDSESSLLPPNTTIAKGPLKTRLRNMMGLIA